MNSRGSVLVIDDEKSILTVLEQYLSKRGFSVETAATGGAALKLLELKEYDVALVDLKLPDKTGLELLGMVKSAHPDMKCIIMTAFASLESTIEALRMNAFDYIQKPFDLVKIGEVVDAAFSDTLLKKENRRAIECLERANESLECSKRDLNERIVHANERLAEANESLKQHVNRLKMLYQMGRDISSDENWADSLDRFLMALCRYLDAEGAALLLFSDLGKALNVRTSYHIDGESLRNAVDSLLEAQMRDTLPSEIFNLESCREKVVRTCLEMTGEWRLTTLPLQYKGRWLGFLVIDKAYESRRPYLNDYHFFSTIQTILTEEVANAVNISRLRTLKNFNETILENINSGVLTTDKAGNIIFLNREAKETLGGGVEGKMHFDELFQNPHGMGSLFERLVDSEDRSYSVESILSLPGGHKVPVRLNTTRVEMDDYHGRTIVAVFEDLTAQKRMEEELRRADRLRSLGELSAAVAHEIRNPLTGIATTAQLLEESLAGEDEKVKYLRVIMDEINRLDEIIKNLLTFARPQIPNPTQLYLGSLIENALALLEDKAGERNVAVSFMNDLRDDRCVLDGDQIKQLVLNIALNGIQACGEGGELKVRLKDSKEPGFVEAAFTDNGDGIPADLADKLYNPFFTTRSGGTGLGLSISRKIVEGHGGRMFFESEKGTGTSFTVTLPRRVFAQAGEKESAKIS